MNPDAIQTILNCKKNLPKADTGRTAQEVFEDVQQVYETGKGAYEAEDWDKFEETVERVGGNLAQYCGSNSTKGGAKKKTAKAKAQTQLEAMKIAFGILEGDAKAKAKRQMEAMQIAIAIL